MGCTHDICKSSVDVYRRKFRSQTSDNMDRTIWTDETAEVGRGREEKESEEKESEEKESEEKESEEKELVERRSEERRSRRAKR